ncbi:MAG: adenylate/guanylate cyclase domain-containing protein [Nannocystaceae bacterium]
MSAADPQALAAFLGRHPWTEALRGGRSTIEWLWSFELDVAADALWERVSDTSRFNRALGLGQMDLEERDGVLHGSTVNGGFRQEWVEVPWTWVAGRSMTAIRRYSRGFARTVRAIYELEPLGDARVRLWVYFGWVPRGLFGGLMLRLGEGVMRRDYGRVLAEVVRDVRAPRPAIYSLPPPRLAETSEAKLAAVCEALRARELPAPVIDLLAAHIRDADPLDLYRLQIRGLARAWGIDTRELLRVCLHATRLGLLEMSWDVVCPHCRGVREELDLLSKVPTAGRCDACDIDFGTGDPESIEITFHVHPSIREVPKQFFCTAEPAQKRHIKLQQALAPGESRTVRPRLAEGRYRLRFLGERDVQLVDVDADDAAAGALDWEAPALPEVGALAPELTLELHNPGDAPRTFIIEEARWSDDALRPAHLFGSREFRDLFSEHFIASDVQIAVGEQVILFTDMVGSTRFYTERGDAAAFVEVRDHFAELTEIYDEAGGALIKTIGDATMAAFAAPLVALQAAQAIQRRFHAGREDSPIRLRISLHVGPCIAVNLNSVVDYFGGTVNAAAKLQSCAEAGQIAMSPAIVESPGVRELLAAEGAQLAEVPFTSAAFAGAITVTRWDVWGDAVAERPASSMIAGARPTVG